MTHASLDQAISACQTALEHEPAGLFTDFDGTLSHMARTPSEAAPAPGAIEALSALVKTVSTVMIVTGRSAGDASEKMGLPDLEIIGNHGLEHIIAGNLAVYPGAKENILAIETAVAAIATAAADSGFLPYLVIENKRLSASVHYRLAQDPEAAYAFLHPIVTEQARVHDLVLTEGKLVIELRPQLQVNKGTAVQHIIEERQLAGVVMLGDDVTDVDAFLAVRQARERGIAGVAVAVISPETPSSVLETADVFVHGVDESIQLLNAVSKHLIWGR